MTSTGYMDETPFGCLVRKELGEQASAGGEPVHVELMRSKELVDYEPVSDVGHLRWMPRGKLIRDLLADYVLAAGPPLRGDARSRPRSCTTLRDRAIYEHADKFGERQYRFKSGNRNMMLRFAACFGMFSIMRDMHISPNTLPMKMYELSTYSFRHEQKGEVIGLKRLRAFTMPDMHILCTDMPEALTCFEEQLAMGWKTGKDFGTDLVGVFRCTRDFYTEHEDWVKKIVADSGRPDADRDPLRPGPLLGRQGRPRGNRRAGPADREPDGPDRCRELDTVRYQVPPGRNGSPPANPPLLTDRQRGTGDLRHPREHRPEEVPMLPTWLSPTQVRVVPVAERHLPFAEEIAERLNQAFIRTDLDDRDESVGKKVREAGMDWVPYVIVVGDAEVESGKLTVTIRKESHKDKPHKVTLSEQEVIAVIRQDIGGMPFRPLYTPRKLSKKARYI